MRDITNNSARASAKPMRQAPSQAQNVINSLHDSPMRSLAELLAIKARVESYTPSEQLDACIEACANILTGKLAKSQTPAVVRQRMIAASLGRKAQGRAK